MISEISALFRQSEVNDPYELYSRMLKEDPVFWDQKNQVWAVYSYADCQALLSSNATRIPFPHNADAIRTMSELTEKVSSTLVRLSNGSSHEKIRVVTTMELFHKMRSIDCRVLLNSLLDEYSSQTEVDFVTICKRLPALAILKSFDFSQSNIQALPQKVEWLKKLMSPATTEQEMLKLNSVIKETYSAVQEHLLRNEFLSAIDKESLFISTANLIGFLIQSDDAVRGLLSNAFLQLMNQNGRLASELIQKSDYERFILEVLRYDPPVHNTRRVLSENLRIHDHEMKEGQTVVIVLAAANRDPAKFENPGEFNIFRRNNDEHLTFGLGPHTCLASHFSTKIAAEILFHLFQENTPVLLNQNISYEPLVNVRLPKSIVCKFR